MITQTTLGQKGRLGNMMFQTANLITISKKNGYKIKVSEHVKNCLWPFNVKFELYTEEETKALNTYVPTGSPTGFDPLVWEQPDNTNFNGIFCNTEYFRDAHEEVQQAFTFREDWVASGKNGINQLCGGKYEIVAIHVRRTDYLKFKHLFAECPLDYYHRGIEHFSSDTHRFLVFSDDIAWCKENLKGENIMYSEGFSQFEDLCLMTSCKHFIIANSTFSWWGAWLATSPNKKVIMPKLWFTKGNPQGLSAESYQMDGWIAI